jgi:hypothetical protein
MPAVAVSVTQIIKYISIIIGEGSCQLQPRKDVSAVRIDCFGSVLDHPDSMLEATIAKGGNVCN